MFLREFRKRFRRKRPALFKSGPWHFHQDNAPVHYSILVTDYLSKMGIKTVPHPPYSPDLAPCDLFPKLWGCRYEQVRCSRRGSPYFPKLQHYWSLAIRLFSVISRTLVGGVLPLSGDVVGVFFSSIRLAEREREWERERRSVVQVTYCYV